MKKIREKREYVLTSVKVSCYSVVNIDNEEKLTRGDEMKTLKIISKKQANDEMIKSLFQGTRTATNKMKYDSGKYKWTGSQKDYIGKECKVSDDVVALWVERRADKNGAYAQLMCLTY